MANVIDDIPFSTDHTVNSEPAHVGLLDLCYLAGMKEHIHKPEQHLDNICGLSLPIFGSRGL